MVAKKQADENMIRFGQAGFKKENCIVFGEESARAIVKISSKLQLDP